MILTLISVLATLANAQPKQTAPNCPGVEQKHSGTPKELCINRLRLFVQEFNQLGFQASCPAKTIPALVDQIKRQKSQYHAACDQASELQADGTSGWDKLHQKLGSAERAMKFRETYHGSHFMSAWGCGEPGTPDFVKISELAQSSTDDGFMCGHYVYMSYPREREPSSTRSTAARWFKPNPGR